MHSHGALTIDVNPARPCTDCLLSRECPACDPGTVGRHAINVATRILHRGDRLFHSGDPFESVYMVRSGMVKTCTLGESGEDRVLGLHAAGDLVGLDAIHDGRHTSSAVVLDTTSVCRLPYEPLCRLSARRPSVQHRLLSKMSQRIRDDEHRLAILAQRSAVRRMASFLTSLIGAHHTRGLRSDEIPLPMPRADIAGYLMLAVETVSRVLTRLQEAGVIDVRRNRIRILDEEALRATSRNMRPDAIRACAMHCEPASN